MSDTDNVQAIIDAARLGITATAVVPTPGLYVAALPNGDEGGVWDYKSFDARREVEGAQDRPNARRGTWQFGETAAFVEYVRSQGAYGNATAVFADRPVLHPTQLRMVAVLNGHAARTDVTPGAAAPLGAAGWGDHRAVLDLHTTVEWDQWMVFTDAFNANANAEGSGRWHEQLAFAEFLEDHAAELRTPDAGTAMDIAKTLDINRSVAYRKAVRVKDGNVNLQYDETTTASAGTDGSLAIPDTFELGIVPFEGANPYQMTARLRWRIKGQDLRLGFALLRPDLVLRSAWNDALQAVRDGAGVPVYAGVPAAVDRA